MQNTQLSPAGRQTVRNALVDFPRPDRAAADAVRKWAYGQGVDLDPDQVEAVTLHYQFHEGRYYAKLVQRLTLTQAVLANWQGESAGNALDRLLGLPWAGNPPPDDFTLVDTLPYHHHLTDLEQSADYAVYNGLYRRGTANRYHLSDHVALPAEAFQAFIWQLDFHTPYKAMLDTYWAKQLDAYGLAAKVALVAACNKQVAEGSLSAAGQQLVWQVAGLAPIPTWSSLGLRSRSVPVVVAAPLSIYGYAATDLLGLYDNATGTCVLYIPGNTSPLHEFASQDALCYWVAEQCKDAHKRAALKAHFLLQDGPDGLSFSGLDTALAGLAAFPHLHVLSPEREGFTTSGVWEPTVYVNYKAKQYSPLITGDLGDALAQRMRQRSYRDGEYIINSDASVTKAKWRGYLDSAVNLLGPLALVVPELAPVFAVAGIAQFGLGLDQAIAGKTLEEQAKGAHLAVFGVLNALPLAHATAEAGARVFTAEPLGFFSPVRLGERIGYPLSPVEPPHLPPLQAAFAQVSSEEIPAVEGFDANVRQAVTRIGYWSGTRDELQSAVQGYLVNVVYDLEHDGFVLSSDENAVNPVYYRAPRSGRNLVPTANPLATASVASRMATLRALGVNLTLPFDLSGPLSAVREEIPHCVSSIWVGDHVINEALLSNIARNAQRLEAANYRFQLFLTRNSGESFARNVRLLNERAPSLHVVTLEDHPLYHDFAQSEYFAQYQAAIDGNGGVATNYASAADVLRYRILHHEGGLYMDLDDELLAPGAPSPTGLSALDLAQTPLAATADGLVLGEPLANWRLGMRTLYNNNVIGSHAGNPTLQAISEEMRLRFAESGDFYTRRPDPTDVNAVRAYAMRLSHLTGPALLNAVIARTRPELEQLRQVYNLRSFKVLNIEPFVPLDPLRKAVNAFLPLGRLVAPGGAQSWLSA